MTPATADHELVVDLLDEYGEITRQTLRQYLHPREPDRHLYAPAADYPERGGRMLRPSLCIATAATAADRIRIAAQKTGVP